MLSTLDVVTYLIFLIFAAVYGYVAYTAIAISRTLSNRVYRYQALGLAVFTLLIVEIALTSVIGTVVPNIVNVSIPDIVNAIQLIGIWFAILIGFFYYVDVSIRAARLTDPLFRDTLHWTKIRVAFWVYDIGAAIVFPLAAAFGSYNYGNGGIPATLQAEVPLLLIIFSGVVVLPIAIRRSKDRALKRQLTWFAVSLALFIIVNEGVGSIPNSLPVEGIFIGLAIAYPLYRSATSLVPLYNFEPSSSPKGPTVSQSASKSSRPTWMSRS